MAIEDVQKKLGNSIVTTDNIHYYETDPLRTFGSNHSGWNSQTNAPNAQNVQRAFAAPDAVPYYKDKNGLDINYKIFCMDIDEPNKDEAPFGFGIRADGKILTGARADEWINKSIQKD